jgi:hypothetical protein
MFRPTTRSSGNEAAFVSFVRQVLSRLLVLDESAPAKNRKGYLEAAARRAGLDSGDHAGLLGWLRRIGLVDYDDDWLSQLERKETGIVVALVKALRKIGLIEVSDERMAELEDVRPVYDLDRLDAGGLVALAEAMYGAAAKAMGR